MEPEFEEQADRVFSRIEEDSQLVGLRDAIDDAIDLICDHPNSAEARRRRIKLPSGRLVWMVQVRYYGDNTNWVILWSPVSDEVAAIVYIGGDSFTTT